MTDPASPKSLDDVMLAMDVVDTLRHRAMIVEKELGVEAREEDMIKRLREIYEAQGIEVPDRILRDGVMALEENRFVYKPPGDGFVTKLAKAYVVRNRWLTPVAAIFGIGTFTAGAYQIGVAGPTDAAFSRARTQLEETYIAASDLAETPFARTRVTSVYERGLDAIEAEKVNDLQAAASELDTIEELLEETLTVRIVSRPGELSGVFRVPKDAPGQRNYYLIVEAVDPAGNVVSIPIESEEDQKTKTVRSWGVRVNDAVFNAVRDDKQDDQIIQNAMIGSKPRGTMRPRYSIPSAGGAILDW